MKRDTSDQAYVVQHVRREPIKPRSGRFQEKEVFDAITNLDLLHRPVAQVLPEARCLPSRLAKAAARRPGDTARQ